MRTWPGAAKAAAATDSVAKIGYRMNHELDEPDKKRSYEPPQLTAISLRPEEAVLGNCKISGTTGPGNNSCAALFCMTLGS
jgi:hypothetical protein